MRRLIITDPTADPRMLAAILDIDWSPAGDQSASLAMIGTTAEAEKARPRREVAGQLFGAKAKRKAG